MTNDGDSPDREIEFLPEPLRFDRPPTRPTIRYALALVVPALTVFRALLDTLLVALPLVLTGMSLLLAVLVAVSLAYSDPLPSARRLFLLGLLAAVLYPLIASQTLAPGNEHVVQSFSILADRVLTWTVAYAVAAFVVYGTRFDRWVEEGYTALVGAVS